MGKNEEMKDPDLDVLSWSFLARYVDCARGSTVVTINAGGSGGAMCWRYGLGICLFKSCRFEMLLHHACHEAPRTVTTCSHSKRKCNVQKVIRNVRHGIGGC